MFTATLVTNKCAELFTRIQDSMLQEIRYAHADFNMNTSFRGCIYSRLQVSGMRLKALYSIDGRYLSE